MSIPNSFADRQVLRSRRSRSQRYADQAPGVSAKQKSRLIREPKWDQITKIAKNTNTVHQFWFLRKLGVILFFYCRAKCVKKKMLFVFWKWCFETKTFQWQTGIRNSHQRSSTLENIRTESDSVRDATIMMAVFLALLSSICVGITTILMKKGAFLSF